MLTKIKWDAVPDYGRERKNPLRELAHETLAEFFEVAEPGDVFEVTGYTEATGDDAQKDAERMRGALRTELFYMMRADDSLVDDLSIFRRRSRLFIERKRPVASVVPRRNPYPGDLPKV